MLSPRGVAVGDHYGFQGKRMGCQSSPTKFKGDYGKLTANERERRRIIKTLRILMGKEGGGGGGGSQISSGDNA